MKNILILIFISMSLTSFGQIKWTSIDDIPKWWIMLQRDSVGYLIYEPCNGSTPRINIDKNNLIIFWQLDAPDTLTINNVTLAKDSKSFCINMSNENSNTEFVVEIKDTKRKLILWTFFGDQKWVMTPQDFTKDFRQIHNPCKTEMKREKQFLPVEF